MYPRTRPTHTPGPAKPLGTQATLASCHGHKGSSLRGARCPRQLTQSPGGHACPGGFSRFPSLLFETRPTVNTELVPCLPLKVWRPRPADALQTGVAFACARGEFRFPRRRHPRRAGGTRPPQCAGSTYGRGSGARVVEAGPGPRRTAACVRGACPAAARSRGPRSTEKPRAHAVRPLSSRAPRSSAPCGLRSGARAAVSALPDAASRAAGSRGHRAPPPRPRSRGPLREGVTGKDQKLFNGEGDPRTQLGPRRGRATRGADASSRVAGTAGPLTEGHGHRAGAARVRGSRSGAPTRSAARRARPTPAGALARRAGRGAPGRAVRGVAGSSLNRGNDPASGRGPRGDGGQEGGTGRRGRGSKLAVTPQPARVTAHQIW